MIIVPRCDGCHEEDLRDNWKCPIHGLPAMTEEEQERLAHAEKDSQPQQ
jgi:hypothetical protein